MSMVVYIYALCEPGQPWNVRYVGKTTQTLELRLQQHIYSAERVKRSHIRNWIRSLLVKGEYPIIKLLDVGDENTWEELERFTIQVYRDAGFRLVNATDGGEGSRGRVITPELRARMSKASSGRVFSKEARVKMSNAQKRIGSRPPSRKGLPHTEEARLKIGIASKARGSGRLGKTNSKEHNDKIAGALKAYWERKRLARL